MGSGQNTIVAMKCLSLLHKYILYGPEQFTYTMTEIECIKEHWVGNQMLGKNNKKDRYRSQNFTNLILVYCDCLIHKMKLYESHRGFI